MIQDLVNKQYYSYFFQGDNYSYVNNANFTPNAHITGYVNGSLVWGQEPPTATRPGTEGADTPLNVTVLGNPAGSSVRVQVAGAQGQPLRLVLTDITGRIVGEHRVEQAGSDELQTLSVDSSRQGCCGSGPVRPPKARP